MILLLLTLLLIGCTAIVGPDSGTPDLITSMNGCYYRENQDTVFMHKGYLLYFEECNKICFDGATATYEDKIYLYEQGYRRVEEFAGKDTVIFRELGPEGYLDFSFGMPLPAPVYKLKNAANIDFKYERLWSDVHYKNDKFNGFSKKGWNLCAER